jgi:hemerythrin-like domain-containing protein
MERDMKRRPTDSLRVEHAELKRHLEHLQGTRGELSEQEPAEQRDAMERFVRFIEGHTPPHAAWEEARLYPLVDRVTGGARPFTATMRYEHALH